MVVHEDFYLALYKCAHYYYYYYYYYYYLDANYVKFTD